MAWIVRSTIIQPDQTDPFVFRHVTIPVDSRAEAVEIARKTLGGYVSVVGYTTGYRTHYFVPTAR